MSGENQDGPTFGDVGGNEDNSSQQNQQPDNQNQKPTDWRVDLIPEDIREEKVFADIKDPQDMARGYFNAQKLVGKEKIVRPDADSPKELWDEYHKVGGRPDEADGYSFAEDFGDDRAKMFDEEGLKGFKALAHENGVSNKAFQEMTKWYADYIAQSQEAEASALDQASREGLAELKKEWVGEDYQNNMRIAQAAIENIGDENLTELILGNEALRNHPSVIKLFHRLGQSMQEHTPLQTDHGGPLRLDGVTQARQLLAKFDEDHHDVLMTVNYTGPKDRNDILNKRFALLQKAYPGTGQVPLDGGHLEMETPL